MNSLIKTDRRKASLGALLGETEQSITGGFNLNAFTEKFLVMMRQLKEMAEAHLEQNPEDYFLDDFKNHLEDIHPELARAFLVCWANQGREAGTYVGLGIGANWLFTRLGMDYMVAGFIEALISKLETLASSQAINQPECVETMSGSYTARGSHYFVGEDVLFIRRTYTWFVYIRIVPKENNSLVGGTLALKP